MLRPRVQEGRAAGVRGGGNPLVEAFDEGVQGGDETPLLPPRGEDDGSTDPQPPAHVVRGESADGLGAPGGEAHHEATEGEFLR